MKIALVDDNPQELKKISQILTDEFNNMDMKIDNIYFFHSGEEFLNKWHTGMYDIVILDIFMENFSRVDVAQKIRETDNDVKLVFCTTSNEFASESYSVDASYYLCKPIDNSTICSMIKKINLMEYELSRYIILSDGQRLILRNMIYSEYYNHTVYIHTKAGEDLQLRIAQAELENSIESFPFFICCFKGIIVNMYEILKRDNDVFIMKNDARVPISRRKAKEIEDTYSSFLFKNVREELVK